MKRWLLLFQPTWTALYCLSDNEWYCGLRGKLYFGSDISLCHICICSTYCQYFIMFPKVALWKKKKKRKWSHWWLSMCLVCKCGRGQSWLKALCLVTGVEASDGKKSVPFWHMRFEEELWFISLTSSCALPHYSRTVSSDKHVRWRPTREFRNRIW